MYYRLIATLSFFTRLPFWRLANVPKEYYERVVPLWPVAGWVTGISMGIAFAVFSNLLGSLYLGVLAALLTRVIITGALHEDGFADFCDGFGGGTTRERTLEIMKDSHIGTYGVLGLLFYIIIMPSVFVSVYSGISTSIYTPQFSANMDPAKVLSAMSDMDPEKLKWKVMMGMATFMFFADVMSKAVSSTIINALPYARKESEAKNKLVYADTPFKDKVATLLTSLLPCLVFASIFLSQHLVGLFIGLFSAIVMRFALVWFMRRKIQGYTGDCCGAMFILCEVAFYLGFLIHMNW